MFRLFSSAAFGALIVAGSPVSAGELSLVVDQDPAFEITPDDEWKFTLGVPGWMVGLDGTFGVKGFTTPFDLDFDTILEHLDAVALLRFEAQKGSVGFILDGLYMKVSDAPGTPGPLFSRIDLGLELGMVEGAVTYRLAESERGSIDLLAGARYIYVGTDLNFVQDESGIEEFSRNVSNAAIGAATDRLRDAAAGAQQRGTGRATSAIVNEVNQQIEARLPSRFPAGRSTPQLGIPEPIAIGLSILRAGRPYRSSRAGRRAGP